VGALGGRKEFEGHMYAVRTVSRVPWMLVKGRCIRCPDGEQAYCATAAASTVQMEIKLTAQHKTYNQKERAASEVVG